MTKKKTDAWRWKKSGNDEIQPDYWFSGGYSPGPSGVRQTRGRLDTLADRRNFFSVDTRAISIACGRGQLVKIRRGVDYSDIYKEHGD